MDIKALAQERGLKLVWLAEQIGVPQARFSEMVNGKKPFPDDKLPRLARALRVSVADIMRETTP